MTIRSFPLILLLNSFFMLSPAFLGAQTSGAKAADPSAQSAPAVQKAAPEKPAAAKDEPAALDRKTQTEAAPAGKKAEEGKKTADGAAVKETEKKTSAEDPKKTPAAKKDKASGKEVKAADPEAEKAAAEEKRKKAEDFERRADIKKAEWIEKTIDFGIQKDRKDAINFIPTVKDPEKKQLLQKKLIQVIETDTDSSILVKSLNIASELNLKEAAPSIKKHLSNDSEDVRIAAVYAIKDLKASELKGDITDKLKSQDFTKESNFTEAMIQTLADFKAIELQDFVIEKIKDNKTSRNLRLALILFLGRSEAVGSKEFLVKTLKDPDEEIDIRSYSVNALSKLDAKDALPDINKIVDEINGFPYQKKKEYGSLYAYCISALVKLGDQNAYPRLLESLKSDNATTRVRAIKLLKDLGDKRSIDILKYKTQYDPSAQVQKEARAALKAMGETVEEESAADPKAKNKIPAKADPKVKGKEEEPAAADDTKQKKREDF